MKKDNIETAINKGLGKGEASQMHEFTLEGHSVRGTSFVLDCLSDSKGRTNIEIRKIFSKRGGALGKLGSASWLFKTQGIFLFHNVENNDQIMEVGIENGAEDIDFYEEQKSVRMTCQPSSFHTLLTALNEVRLPPTESQITMTPSHTVPVSTTTENDARWKLEQLIEDLDDHEDVQNVYHNVEFIEEDS
eukprot:gb/GECH01010005.1/.p1 GENE.gb/GECH01010005.1/~~gb/GECH01010005.1/.p1  ORF type:complete len:190 (+),score=46.10 gb/GECH01010005.1/:1-570(+)